MKKTLLILMVLANNSCINKSYKYSNILKNNLSEFNICISQIIRKYSKDSNIIIMPSQGTSHRTISTIYDTSLYEFCKKFDVNSIDFSNQIVNDTRVFQIEFSLADNNIIYLYNSSGFDDHFFENNRIIIIPITQFWQFQQIKKEW